MCALKAHIGIVQSVPTSVPKRGPTTIIRQPTPTMNPMKTRSMIPGGLSKPPLSHALAPELPLRPVFFSAKWKNTNFAIIPFSRCSRRSVRISAWASMPGDAIHTVVWPVGGSQARDEHLTSRLTKIGLRRQPILGQIDPRLVSR
jgi:hypothetical protein